MPETKRPDANPATSTSGKFRPLRIWPAVLLIAAMLVLRFLAPLFEDGSTIPLMIGGLGPTAIGLLVVIWWLTFSRASMSERIVGLIGIVLAAGASIGLADKTLGIAFAIMVTVPLGIGAFAVGAVLCSQWQSFNRTIVAVLVATCGFGFTTLIHNHGIWGHGGFDWSWRWASSAHEKMLAQKDLPTSNVLTEVPVKELDQWLAQPEWPRFRGSDGLSRRSGPPLDLDWEGNSPEQIWKIPVGPGWSSFAVAGNLLFTQEQLQDQEAVVCYAADSGKVIWTQQISSRFDDPLGGPGPRATPTLAQGMLFAQGANGILQRLDPKTGAVVWTKDLREVAQRQPPTWGFSSSPLVIGSVVIAYAGGESDKGTLAFDINNGDLKWSASAGDHSYCSPQLATIDGKQNVLMLTNQGLNVLDPESGRQLLDYQWELSGYRAIQPQVVDGDSILLPSGPGTGTRRIRIANSESGLTAEEMWTSLQFKPDFNDFVVYENHLYGFDGTIFTCVDLANGQRKWKGGRYGKGQVLLLADSGTLLVASEFGDVILLAADPSQHQELTKFQALEGRTWNHPVLVGDRLYIRNSQEAACYRMPLAAKQENVATAD